MSRVDVVSPRWPGAPTSTSLPSEAPVLGVLPPARDDFGAPKSVVRLARNQPADEVLVEIVDDVYLPLVRGRGGMPPKPFPVPGK